MSEFVNSLRLIPKLVRDAVDLVPLMLDIKFGLAEERQQWETIYGDLDRWEEVVCHAEDLASVSRPSRAEWVQGFLVLAAGGWTADEIMKQSDVVNLAGFSSSPEVIARDLVMTRLIGGES